MANHPLSLLPSTAERLYLSLRFYSLYIYFLANDTAFAAEKPKGGTKIPGRSKPSLAISSSRRIKSKHPNVEEIDARFLKVLSALPSTEFSGGISSGEKDLTVEIASNPNLEGNLHSDGNAKKADIEPTAFERLFAERLLHRRNTKTSGSPQSRSQSRRIRNLTEINTKRKDSGRESAQEKNSLVPSPRQEPSKANRRRDKRSATFRSVYVDIFEDDEEGKEEHKCSLQLLALPKVSRTKPEMSDQPAVRRPRKRRKPDVAAFRSEMALDSLQFLSLRL